jgi:large repetitive protein
MRSIIPLLVAATAGLYGQALPSFLQQQYPPAGATGVPTNASILLMAQGPLTQGMGAATYALKTGAGTSVALVAPSYYVPSVTIAPAAPLAPSTRYTFTMTPPATIAPPYSFDFTTGAGPDNAGPRLVGFSPPSGTTGVGINGPFIAQFDKPLMGTALFSGAVSIKSGGYGNATGIFPTADWMGIIITPQPVGWATFFQITVDPSKLKDAQGNAGQGVAQTAQYSTFIAASTGGPVLAGFFPADGSSGLPSNVDIRILFDRPIDPTTTAAITLTVNGSAVPVRYNMFASNAGVELKPQNLLAANAVCQVTIGTGLQDQNGLALSQAHSFQFTSSGNPDLAPAQSLGMSPSYNQVAPLNSVVAFRANKPILPLAALELTRLTGGDNPPVSAAFSADGQTLVLTPQAPLTPGVQYGVSFWDVVDVTGAPFYQSTMSFTPGSQTDTAPPAILTTSIVDGAQGVLLNTQPMLAFSEPVFIPADAVQLLKNGRPVSISTNSSTPTFLVVQPGGYVPFDPSTMYTLALNGVADLAGNPLPPFSMQFTTAASGSSGTPVTLLSSFPAQGDQNVDVNISITLNFSANVSPMAAYSGSGVLDSVEGVYPCTTTVSGNSVTITPTHPLLPNSTITASISSSDPLGNPINARVTFVTGNSSDTTPFQVTAISPPDGSVLGSQSSTITLTLSAPVNPGTLTGSGLTVYSGGVASVPKAARSNNDLTISFPNGCAGSDCEIVASPALTNVAGTPVAAFRAHYTMANPPLTNSTVPNVMEMRPPGGSSGVPANTEITWFLSSPVDPAAVRAALMVIAAGAPVAGTFNVFVGGKVLTFTPSANFPAGATVQIYQRTPIFSLPYQSSFQIAPALTTLEAIGVTPANGGPANSVIEVLFSGDVVTGQGLVTLTLNGATVPTNESVPRPRVIRLTPVKPLEAGYYYLQIAPKVVMAFGYSNAISLTLSAPATPATGNPVVGPQPNSSGVPLNASVRIAFAGGLNPLSVNSAAVTLQVGGTTLATLQHLSGDGRGLVVTPVEAFPANTTVQVVLSGLTDLYGNAIPARAWSFTTGTAPDFAPPGIVETSLNDTPGSPQIPANSAVAVVFNKPMDPQTATSAYLGFAYPGPSSNPLPVNATFSDDLRTLTVSGVPAFPKGMSFDLSFRGVVDLSGNGINSPLDASFQVAFDPDTTPPNLLAVSPADGQTDLPLNAEIIASFDKPLMQISLGNITLVSGNTTIPLLVLNDDYRRARLAPALPLAPDTTYTVTISGVTDLSGNAMAGTPVASFTTGENVDVTPPAGTPLTPGAPNAQVRILFSKPVSPATVDSHSVLLSTFPYNQPSVPVPSAVSLSPDGTMVTVTPVNPLTPGTQYSVSLARVRDFAGNLATLPVGYNTFTEAYAPDTALPMMIVTPPDGTTGVPLNANLAAAATKTFLAPPGTFQFSSNGQPLPGKVTQSSSGFSFVPSFPLQPNTQYRIAVGSVTDFEGNVSAPVSSTFTTGAANENSYSSNFKLLSATPASGDAGVDVNAPIVLTFSQPVDPTSVGVGSIYISSSFPVLGSFSVSGGTVTFTPSAPWPAASTISVNLNTRFGILLRDLAGASVPLYGTGPPLSYSFKTGAAPGSASPQLISVSPQPGTLLSPPTATFRLTFSENVAPGSGGLSVFAGSQPASGVNLLYDPSDYRVIDLAANVPANSQLTVIGNSSIVDRTGNSLTPFSYTYPTGPDNTAKPSVTSVTPYNGSSNVASTTPIALQFSKALDPASAQAGIRVTQDGENFSGALTFSNGNQTVQFTPGAPYHAGSRIDVFVLETVADPFGNTIGQRYNSSFTVGTTTTYTEVVMTSFAGNVAPEGVLELGFSRPLDPAAVNADGIWLRSGRRLVPGTAVLSDDGLTVRFLPGAPLAEGAEYVLTVGAGLREASGGRVHTGEFRFLAETLPPVAIETVGTARHESRLAVRVSFNGPVNPLSISRLAVLGPDGREIPAERRLAVDCRSLLLIPLGSGFDPATLRLDDRGLEDRSGRPLAARSSER